MVTGMVGDDEMIGDGGLGRPDRRGLMDGCHERLSDHSLPLAYIIPQVSSVVRKDCVNIRWRIHERWIENGCQHLHFNVPVSGRYEGICRRSDG